MEDVGWGGEQKIAKSAKGIWVGWHAGGEASYSHIRLAQSFAGLE